MQIDFLSLILQCAPVFVAGNEEQKKKYFGRLTEAPVMAVS